MLSTVLVATPLMALLVVVQAVIIPKLSFLDAAPSLPLLFALAWSMLASLDEGIVWAFIGGLFMDIFTVAPVGGMALTYMAAIFAASFVKDLLPANRVLVPMAYAIVATLVQQLLYMIYLRLFGIALGSSITALIQLVILQAVLVIPIYWLLYLIRRTTRLSTANI